jgi:exodeoxyribonuclease-3
LDFSALVIMKIATWNVNGIRARQEQVLAWIQTEKPDVMCLQETKSSPEQVPESLRMLEGYWSYWHGFKGYSGVALLIRKAWCAETPHFFHPKFDMENRMVAATVQGVTFASIYVPNGGKDFGAKLKFLEELQDFAQGFKKNKETLVLCGDFNVAHKPMDVHPRERREVVGQLPMERALLDDILSHGLTDLGRRADPKNDALFSWWAPWREMRQRNIGWRLDYIYASEKLTGQMTSCRVLRDFGTSDHAPVLGCFSL